LGSFFRLWCAYVLCLGSSNLFGPSFRIDWNQYL
jgi:hypothetical protein